MCKKGEKACWVVKNLDFQETQCRVLGQEEGEEAELATLPPGEECARSEGRGTWGRLVCQDTHPVPVQGTSARQVEQEPSEGGETGRPQGRPESGRPPQERGCPRGAGSEAGVVRGAAGSRALVPPSALVAVGVLCFLPLHHKSTLPGTSD